MTWIQDEADFSEKAIRERAKKFGFSNPLPVELFLWDCEIAAQLQKESADFVLKGGAAAQLHLPVQKQRASVDVDIVCDHTKDEVAAVLARINQRVPTLKFEEYKPKRPKKEISMVTYLAKVPELIPSKYGKPREIKIDVLLEDVKLHTEVCKNVETFSIRIKELKCYSATSLLGDKILTLAENTIGISDSTDIPKQIYDVSSLSEEPDLTKGGFLEIHAAVTSIVPLEAGYRGLATTVAEALTDVEATMEKYSLLDTAGADAEIKRNIVNFQQFYVSASQKWPWYEWCARALRIRFLSQLLRFTVEKNIDAGEACNQYNSATQTAQRLVTIRGEKTRMLNKMLMDSAEAKTPYSNELKGKPLHRVFWQVVTQDNLSKILEAINAES